ncbi:MAG: hypothetical protein HIU86_14110 [Acidobacteria bacterium]|nr:hypothetical protein [Acidobacteriota bacterium]
MTDQQEPSTPVSVAPSPKSHTYFAMVPSESFEPLPSTATFRPATLEVNAAVGAAFVGVVAAPGVVATRSSTFHTIGPLETPPPVYVRSPMVPALCSDEAVSVVVTCQLVGSVEATGHTFALSVVGLVPVASTRNRRPAPAAAVRPGTRMPFR